MEIMAELEEESKTIRQREYRLSLSDADALHLAKKALRYGLSVSELLENFIADLVNGTESNGPAERQLAAEWADRCWFAMTPQRKNLTTFLFSEEYLGGYSYEHLVDISDRMLVDECNIYLTKKIIADLEVALAENESLAVKESLDDEKESLRGYQEELEELTPQLDDLKAAFRDYMDGVEYNWEAQVAACHAWYQNNVQNMLLPPVQGKGSI